jgi:hypothetical protein
LQPSQPAAVLDEAQLPEFVHETIYPRSSGPDHFRQHFLRDSGNHLLRLILFAVTRQQQQSPGQAFLGRVEKLIYQVFRESDVSREHLFDEPLGESPFRV